MRQDRAGRRPGGGGVAHGMGGGGAGPGNGKQRRGCALPSICPGHRYLPPDQTPAAGSPGTAAGGETAGKPNGVRTPLLSAAHRLQMLLISEAGRADGLQECQDCSVLSTPRETRRRERERNSVSTEATHREDKGEEKVPGKQDAKYSRSHHQVVSENMHAKAEQGIPCLSSAYFSLLPQDHLLRRNTFRCAMSSFSSTNHQHRASSPRER